VSHNQTAKIRSSAPETLVQAFSRCLSPSLCHMFVQCPPDSLFGMIASFFPVSYFKYPAGASSTNRKCLNRERSTPVILLLTAKAQKSRSTSGFKRSSVFEVDVDKRCGSNDQYGKCNVLFWLLSLMLLIKIYMSTLGFFDISRGAIALPITAAVSSSHSYAWTMCTKRLSFDWVKTSMSHIDHRFELILYQHIYMLVIRKWIG